MTNTIIHVGDVGTVFELTITEQDGTVVDVSSVATKTIYFKKPNSAKIAATASFTTNGTDGKIKYASQTNDIDMAGLWKIQGYVEFASGDKFYSEVVSFTVRANINN